jgi:ketosteroid isomerase-like protein
MNAVFSFLLLLFNYTASITTAQSGFSDEASTFQGGVIPQAGDIVVIRAGDTLKVRNHFYCKDIVYAAGTPKGVLSLSNLSFLHTQP